MPTSKCLRLKLQAANVRTVLTRLRCTRLLALLLLWPLPCLPQSTTSCLPGWEGQALVNGESLAHWQVEISPGSSGSLALVAGEQGQAVQLRWTLGAGSNQYVQARYNFSPPVDLSNYDVFGLTLRGSAGANNLVSFMFADTRGVFYGLDCEGLNTLNVWMRNLCFPRRMFHYFFTIPEDPQRRTLDWSQINRFFVVIKRPDPNRHFGGSGQLDFSLLQAGRAALWPRPAQFDTVQTDSAVASRALNYLLSQQQATGLLISWKEEKPQPLAHLYDQALALLVFSRAGHWSQGMARDAAARAAQQLVQFVNARQETDGHWPRTWQPVTGALRGDNRWVGDQAWWIMALAEYVTHSGDSAAWQAAQRGADWLAAKIDDQGRVIGPDVDQPLAATSTEGTVDVWWAMVATRRFVPADQIQAYLLHQLWDADLRYWWRGRDLAGNPDPVVAMDCATWTAAFARSARVQQPEMALAALGFVRRALVTTAANDLRCGFDGMGPVSLWCEGTAQFVSAGGEQAQEFLNTLLSLQRPDGGMPGALDSLASACHGWLTRWTGVAPTAWLYFALTRPPFPETGSSTAVAATAAAQIPYALLLHVSPNPVGPATTFRYYLAQAAPVQLRLYDLTGREVAGIVAGWQTAGWHQVGFAATRLPAGVYLVRLSTPGATRTVKILRLQRN